MGNLDLVTERVTRYVEATSSTSTPPSRKRLYTLVFLEYRTRRLHITGVTTHLTQNWTTPQARKLTTYIGKDMGALRFLLRDRNRKYSVAFDAVFQADNIDILTSAPQAPQMNAHYERVIRTLRNETHAREVLAEYQRHYNQHRPTKPCSNDHPSPTDSRTQHMRPTPAHCYAPASSEVSSTSTDMRLDVQR